MQMKTDSVAAAFSEVDLSVNIGKSKTLRYNRENINTEKLLKM